MPNTLRMGHDGNDDPKSASRERSEPREGSEARVEPEDNDSRPAGYRLQVFTPPPFEGNELWGSYGHHDSDASSSQRDIITERLPVRPVAPARSRRPIALLIGIAAGILFSALWIARVRSSHDRIPSASATLAQDPDASATIAHIVARDVTPPSPPVDIPTPDPSSDALPVNAVSDARVGPAQPPAQSKTSSAQSKTPPASTPPEPTGLTFPEPIY